MFKDKKEKKISKEQQDELARVDAECRVDFIGKMCHKEYRKGYRMAKDDVLQRRMRRRSILDFTLSELIQLYQEDMVAVWHMCHKIDGDTKWSLYDFLQKMYEENKDFIDECKTQDDFLSELMTDEDFEKDIIYWNDLDDDTAPL